MPEATRSETTNAETTRAETTRAKTAMPEIVRLENLCGADPLVCAGPPGPAAGSTTRIRANA